MSDRIDQLASAAEARELAQLMDWSAPGVADPPPPSVFAGPELRVTGDAPEAAPSHIDRYTLVEKIGEGGFGAVFLAEQQHPVRRSVALKILKAGMDTKQVIARFDAERQALALMDHPNIARVLDVGATDAGRPYFVMDLIRGTPITRYCDEHKLTIRQRLELFLQVCQGVQHAHTKAIIHRDLKPSNVLVMEADGVAVPKVIDFGIAKATTGQLTEMTLLTELRQFLGTPQYMSPEQADGSADIDTRSDVYSLGVILYELLSGTTPFDFKSSGFAEIHRIIREVEPPPPSARAARHELRGELDWIVLRAMEKDRARRYETASAFAMDIQRYLRNEPVAARQAGRIYRFRKLVRRNKLAFAAGTALVSILAIGLITSTFLYVKARDAKTAQSILRDDAEANGYASDMLGIQQALSLNNLGRARELLDRHRPRPGERDRRGWEWRYLCQQCQSDARALASRTDAPISSLSVSHDGRWAAYGSLDGGNLSVCDLQTRKEIARPKAGDSAVWTAFSPRESLLAYSSVSRDNQGRLSSWLHFWDPLSRRERPTVPLNERCVGLVFSQDGQTLVTSTLGPRGELTLWQVADGSKRTVPAPQTSWWPVNATAFAATADLSAAAVAPDGSLVLIDLITGKPRWRNEIPSGTVMSMAFSPNGGILAVTTGPGLGVAESAIHLLDTANGKPLGPPLEGHRAWVGALVFGSDGRTLASASADQTLRLWDVSDPTHGKPIGRPLRGHTHEVWRLAFVPPANTTLISGSIDGTSFLWDSSEVREDRAHVKFPAVGWGFQNTGASVLRIDDEGRVFRHDGNDLKKAWPVMELGEKVDGASFLHGRLLLVHCGNGLCLWDLATKKRLMTRPIFEGNCDFCAPTPQAHCLTYIRDDDTVHEWDLLSGQELQPWHTQGGLSTVAFSRDGRLRLSLAYGGTGMLTEMVSGHSSILSLDTWAAEDACFSPNGTLVAVTCEMGLVKLWNTADLVAGGKPPSCGRLSAFTLGVHSVAFSPDGRRLAAGSGDAEAIKLWDMETRQEVLNVGAHGLLFSRTEFSPDGSVLAASNRNGELHLWRAPTLAEIDAAEANGIAR